MVYSQRWTLKSCLNELFPPVHRTQTSNHNANGAPPPKRHYPCRIKTMPCPQMYSRPGFAEPAPTLTPQVSCAPMSSYCAAPRPCFSRRQRQALRPPQTSAGLPGSALPSACLALALRAHDRSLGRKTPKQPEISISQTTAQWYLWDWLGAAAGIAPRLCRASEGMRC